MPAAAIKGIIISISIITALGVAVLENPQIQAWLEQQRQNIIELLRNLNEELDPQSRRTAEAFAFEGRTVANDPGLRREASGSLEAAAVATGRSLANPSTMRRIPVHGPPDADAAEERRKRGREYLAQRNQQMFELKQRKKTIKIDVTDAEDDKPSSPTSFDEMVDKDGKLRSVESEQLTDSPKAQEILLPDPPLSVPGMPEDNLAEMRQVDPMPLSPLLAAGPSSSTAAWDFGALLANPFADEHAFDRSETPKPPVPPKVSFSIPDDPPTPTMPGSFTPRGVEPDGDHRDTEQEELSYEEQLAIALSLSEAEAAKAASRAVERMSQSEEDHDLRAAIEASLKRMAAPQLVQASASSRQQPLVDASPPSPIAPAPRSAPRRHWESLFDQSYSPTREPLSLASPRSAFVDEEDLYRVTPELTQARLATLNSQSLGCSAHASSPLHEARTRNPGAAELRAAMEASFYSAASSAPSPASTHTLAHTDTLQLIDVTEDAQEPERAQTPISRPSRDLQNEFQSDSDEENFASASPGPMSRSQSRPRSEVSNIEVIDLAEDSDVDMLSEEDDGIATPDSWTEVGSRDGESEMDEDDERPWRQRVHLG